MSAPKDVDLPIDDLCNQVIHSWIWMLSATEDPPHRFDGILVSSDRVRRQYLYLVSAANLIQLFRAVGADDIVEMVLQRDRDGLMHVVKASRKIPPGSALLSQDRNRALSVTSVITWPDGT